MITYDPDNPVGPLGRVLSRLPTLVSESASFQTLCEAVDAATARKKVHVGAAPDPWNEDAYELDEIENRFCELYIVWPTDGSGLGVQFNDGSPTPYHYGSVQMALLRLARKAEVEHLGEGDLLAAFASHAYMLMCQVMASSAVEVNAANNLRLEGRIEFAGGPSYGGVDRATGQGDFMWATYTVDFGDNAGE